MKYSIHITLVPVLLLLFVCSNLAPVVRWKTLFNGKDLKGWDTYLGPRYDSALEKFDGEPIGLNHDPDKVFSVVKEDGKGALRVSGQHFGGMSTKEEFENYHLQLEFKWGKLQWNPRKHDKRDNGVLYHAVGPHAKGWFFWMRSEELQVQEGDCGDYWGVAGAGVTTRAVKRNENEFVYDPSGEMMPFGGVKDKMNDRVIKGRDGEKPYGQWNTIDLYCHGDTSVHVINGVVTMVLYNLRQLDGEQETPLTKGKIQIQSEGAEIFYRNIRIQPIENIPGELLRR